MNNRIAANIIRNLEIFLIQNGLRIKIASQPETVQVEVLSLADTGVNHHMSRELKLSWRFKTETGTSEIWLYRSTHDNADSFLLQPGLNWYPLRGDELHDAIADQ